MTSVIFSTILLLAIAGAISASERIAGSADIDIKAAPWQVSLQTADEGHFCGGAILNQQYILTTARCIQRFEADPSNLTIRAGVTLNDADGGQTLAADFVAYHTRYNAELNDFDFGLIRLKTKLEYVSRVKPVRLHGYGEEHLVVDCIDCLVTGWGRFVESFAWHSDADSSNHLHGIEVSVFSRKECKEVYGDKLTHRMICAGLEQRGEQLCPGDAGSPLIAFDGQKRVPVVIGLVSWGQCNQAKPEVYAKVIAANEWIRLFVA